FKAPDYISSCGYCQAPPKPDSSPIFCNHCYRVAYCDERSVEVHIEHSKSIRRSSLYNNGFSDNDDDDDDDDDRFSDIENTDWVTIKSILSTSDSWSIVRIGDYFVKKNKNKKSSKQKLHTKENIADDTSTNNNN
ncbi:unnamed protein product, partial [Rotaria magnacalcarata]